MALLGGKKQMFMTIKPRTTVFLLALLVLVSGCNSPEEKVAHYLEHGNKLYDAGEFQKARLDYKNAEKIKPTDAQILYHLGLVDEAENNLKSALDYYTSASQQDMHFHPAIIKLAEYHMLIGQDEEAKSKIDSILSDDPNNAEAHGLRSIFYVREKNYKDAETEAHLTLNLDVKNISAYSALAAVYENQNNANKAIETVKTAEAQNPKNISVLLLLANIYSKNNNVSEMVATYEKIFSIDPKDAGYRLKLALALSKSGHMDEAEKVLRDACAALPDNTELQHQLVEFLSSNRSLEASEKEIRSIMALHQGELEPYSWMVELYISHNLPDRATTFLTENLAHPESEKQEIMIKSLLSRIYLLDGNNEKAHNLSDEVLAKDINNFDAHFVRASLLASDGKFELAIAELRTILGQQPHSAQALNLLSNIYQRQGHLDLAIETYNQLVEAQPLELGARVRLAELYVQNNNPQHAMDILFAVTKLDSKFAAAWQATAQLAIAQNNLETADMAIGKLEALDGQHDYASFLRAQYLAKSGKLDEAVAKYRTVINSNPMSSLAENALTLLTALYEKANRDQEAINYINSLKLDSPFASTLLGYEYLKSHQTDLARQSFDAAINAHSMQQDPYLERAKLFLADHDNEKAIAILDKGIETSPTDPRARILKAQIYEESGKYKEAIDCYSYVLDRNPGLDLVANNLAEVIADSSYNDSTALEKARLIAERFAGSTNPLLLDTLAWVYFRQGNIDQAQTLMVRASSMQSDLPSQFHYHYGAILYKAGNLQLAAEELKKATSKETNYLGYEDAKNLLTSIK